MQKPTFVNMPKVGLEHRKTLRFFRCKGEVLRAPEILMDFRAAH